MSFLFGDGQNLLAGKQVLRTWLVSVPLELGLQILVTVPRFLLLKNVILLLYVWRCFSCMYICAPYAYVFPRGQERVLYAFFFFNLKNC